MSRGGNIQGVVHLQNQNYFGKAYSVGRKVMNGHKNPNDSHNYQDENHVEMEYYQGAPNDTQHLCAHPKTSPICYVGFLTNQYTMSHGTYNHIMI